MNDFIVEYDDALPSELCQEIMARFEQDPRKCLGVTPAGYSPDLKRTMELPISRLDDWRDLDGKIFLALGACIRRYKDQFPILGRRDHVDHGYQIKKYGPGDFFEWHCDNDHPDYMARQYIAIFYLNDVLEGGETEFRFFDKKIKPKAGKVVFFPAAWTYEHRGVAPVTGDKYVVTAFMSIPTGQNQVLTPGAPIK